MRPDLNRSADLGVGQGPDLGSMPPPLRVAAGLGDAERERALLRPLQEDGGIVVAERCLAAEPLVKCARSGRVDVAIVAADLHRLTGGALISLAQTHLPVVLLAARPEEDRWNAFPWPVLPLEAGPEAVRLALLAAVRGEHVRPVGASSSSVAQAVTDHGLSSRSGDGGDDRGREREREPGPNPRRGQPGYCSWRGSSDRPRRRRSFWPQRRGVPRRGPDPELVHARARRPAHPP